MSVPRKTVALAPDARLDFIDILLYTRRQWGEEQAHRDEAILTAAIASLADHPEAGMRRDHLFVGGRVRAVERHLLLSQIGETVIDVVRIIHERADAGRHLGPRRP